MKTILTHIGILFLISSCCFTVKDDIRRSWSFKYNECRCQWYSVKKVKNKTKFIRCEDFFDKYFPKKERLSNEEYCHDLVGFSKESWAKNLTPRGRESKRCYEGKRCKR